MGVQDDGRVVGARHRHGATTDTRRVEALVSNATRPSLAVMAEMVEVYGHPVLMVRVPHPPVGTWSGRYLRRALGGDGKPACVPFFVYETAAHGLSRDPSTAVVPGATWDDLDPIEIARFRRLARESGGRGDAALLRLSDEEPTTSKARRRARRAEARGRAPRRPLRLEGSATRAQGEEEMSGNAAITRAHSGMRGSCAKLPLCAFVPRRVRLCWRNRPRVWSRARRICQVDPRPRPRER